MEKFQSINVQDGCLLSDVLNAHWKSMLGKSYFLSEDVNDARFQRLVKAFENPLTEVVLFFIMQPFLFSQASICCCSQKSH